MAKYFQQKQQGEARLAVFGTPMALKCVWDGLKRVVTSIEDGVLLIPERALEQGGAYPGPILLRASRVMQLASEELLLELLTALHQEQGREAPFADVLMVAVGLSVEERGRSRRMLKLVDELQSLTAEQGGLTQVTVGVGGDASGWEDIGGEPLPDLLRDAEGALDRIEVQALLRAATQRMREQWEVRAPQLVPPWPQNDLPNALRAEAARAQVAEEEGESPQEQAKGRLKLAQLYRRAGYAETAGGLFRGALARGGVVWRSLETQTPAPSQMERLSSWSAAGTPAGVVLGVRTGEIIAATDLGLRRLSPDGGVAPISLHADPPFVLKRLDQKRALLVGRTLTLFDLDSGEVLAQRALGERRDDPLYGIFLQGLLPRRLRVRGGVAQGRIALLTSRGVSLFELPSLKAIGGLARGDILDVALTPEGDLLMVMESGTVVVWSPFYQSLEQRFSCGGSVLDASFSTEAGLVSVLSQRAKGQVEAAFFELPSGEFLSHMTSAGMSSLRLSEDGQRLFTLEHRMLRVRDVSEGLQHACEVKTLYSPPPWTPIFMDYEPSGRFVAVQSRTYYGQAPLRVSLWG